MEDPSAISHDIHSVGLDGKIKGFPFHFTAHGMGELISLFERFKNNPWLRRRMGAREQWGDKRQVYPPAHRVGAGRGRCRSRGRGRTGFGHVIEEQEDVLDFASFEEGEEEEPSVFGLEDCQPGQPDQWTEEVESAGILKYFFGESIEFMQTTRVPSGVSEPVCSNQSKTAKENLNASDWKCDSGGDLELTVSSGRPIRVVGHILTEYLGCVAATGSDLMYVQIKLQNGLVACLEDSGASMRIMSLNLCKKLKLEDQLEKEQRNVLGFNNACSETVGKVRVKVTLGKKTKEVPFFVLSSPVKCILGKPKFADFNLMIDLVSNRLVNRGDMSWIRCSAETGGDSNHIYGCLHVHHNWSFRVCCRGFCTRSSGHSRMFVQSAEQKKQL